MNYDWKLSGGAGISQPTTINSAGLVTGSTADGTGVPHAYLYANGTTQELPDSALPGTAAYGSNVIAINSLGQIIGEYGPTYRPHIYTSGLMTDLNSLISPRIPADAVEFLERQRKFRWPVTALGIGGARRWTGRYRGAPQESSLKAATEISGSGGW